MNAGDWFFFKTRNPQGEVQRIEPDYGFGGRWFDLVSSKTSPSKPSLDVYEMQRL